MAATSGSTEVQANGEARCVGQLMPLEDVRFPVVVLRRTCTRSDQYLGRLPAGDDELAEYKRNCGMDPRDIYRLG